MFLSSKLSPLLWEKIAKIVIYGKARLNGENTLGYQVNKAYIVSHLVILHFQDAILSWFQRCVVQSY